MVNNVLPMVGAPSPFDPLGFTNLEPGMTQAAKDEFESRAQDEYAFSACLARIAETEDGKKMFKWLEGIVRAPTWQSSIAKMNGMEAACAHGFAREGQNALIEDILRRIEIVKDCKTPEDYVRISLMKGQDHVI